MPIDSGIYSQIQQQQPSNPLAMLAQAQQIRHLQQAGDQADMAAQQQNRLLQLVQDPSFATLPTAQKAQRLQSVGAFDKAGALVQADAAANKDQRAADTSELDMKVKRLDAAANIAGSVTDQASYQRALPMMQDLGFDVSKFSPQYNADGVKQFAMATLSAKERLANQTAIRGQDITMRGQDLTQGTALRGQDLSRDTALRGQDLTDFRSREANMNRRVPSGYRAAADGTLEFIPGGPADPNTKPAGGKPLNDTQAKALQFGTRMQASEDILNDMASQGVEQPGLIKRAADLVGAGPAANFTQSGKQQQVEQAQRDFINAVLRRESGAAISEGEFDNARKQYFPQPNDKPENVAQKKANRELATRGILAEVPDAENRVAQVRGTAAKPAASGVVAVTDAASYAKVPSGATYTTPDGKTRRKP